MKKRAVENKNLSSIAFLSETAVKSVCRKTLSELNLAKILAEQIKQADRPFWFAAVLSFLTLNIIFLFHGVHYMFGDHDWKYLQNGISPTAGLFEGRFSQFIPVNLLAKGEILPIINNAAGFAFFSLGIALLARYWRLPHQKTAYALFSLFIALTPYILSFMYFAFLVMPVLGWNMFVIGALLISEKEETFSLLRTLSALMLTLLALGGYPPVVNLFAVALSTRLLFATLYEKATVKEIIRHYRWTIINLLLSIVCYKFCLWGVNRVGALNSAYYNLQTVPFSEWGRKFITVAKDLPRQFVATLPFITDSYKTAAGVVVLSGLGSFISALSQNRQSVFSILLLIAVFFAPLLTLFISASLVETEFSPRVDFFGLVYFYAALLAVTLKTAEKYHSTVANFCKNIAGIAAVTAICLSCENLFEAQKIWKLGFDAELKLYRRAGIRFLMSPDFSLSSKYIMVQAGSPSFRSRFYHRAYKYKSDDLLGISFVPGMNPAVMWNYYGITNYADPIAYVYTFRPDAVAAEIIRTAKPYPAISSTHVVPSGQTQQNWILQIFSEDAKDYLLKQYGM